MKPFYLITYSYWKTLVLAQKVRVSTHKTFVTIITLLFTIASMLSIGIVNKMIWGIPISLFSFYCMVFYDALTMNQRMLCFLIRDNKPRP